ncbi:MAG: DUF4230 domain-containing protein [Lachnospiraceae bacterium]|nr:DUF4230 domain-containing protein [Lachnospiraceae bacterium]
MSDERRSYLADSVLKWVWIGTIIISLVLGIIITWKLVSNYYQKHPVEVQVETEEVVPEIIEEEKKISHQTVESGIQGMGELVTAEYHFTHVEQFDKTKKWGEWEIPLTESGFVYSFDGKIKAGVDFNEIELEVNEEDEIVTVTIPEAKIISSEIDNDSFHLYDEKQSPFNPVSIEDGVKSIDGMQKYEEQKALGDGLLDQAQENAESMVEGFLENAYEGTDYDVEIVNTAEEKEN